MKTDTLKPATSNVLFAMIRNGKSVSFRKAVYKFKNNKFYVSNNNFRTFKEASITNGLLEVFSTASGREIALLNQDDYPQEVRIKVKEKGKIYGQS